MILSVFFVAPGFYHPKGVIKLQNSLNSAVTNSHELSTYERAMLRANELSLQGLGYTAPNPIVGAVILNHAGVEIASGFHAGGFHAGGDHAEIVAINQALQMGLTDFSEFTLVVTLEPCNHHGKTPPCTDSIIRAGFKRVIFAVSDPNEIAAGGAAKLRAANIEVVSGVQSALVSYSNRAWLHKARNSRPWILTKIAATIDGKIAALDATSKWITSEDSRADVAKLRFQSDAILTSTATVLADDSHLIPRDVLKLENIIKKANPVRIVVGKRALPSNSKILDDAAETVLMKTHDFSELIDLAKNRGWNQVLVEAGAELNSALLQAELIDELVIYMAPTMLGSGKNLIGDLGISTLADRKDFSFGKVDRLGRDLRIQLLAKDFEYLSGFENQQIWDRG